MSDAAFVRALQKRLDQRQAVERFRNRLNPSGWGPIQVYEPDTQCVPATRSADSAVSSAFGAIPVGDLRGSARDLPEAEGV